MWPALPDALLCKATCCLGDGQCVILRQMVRGSHSAVRAIRNTRWFQTETRAVADERPIPMTSAKLLAARFY